jgi:hypothetical protein
LRTQKGEVQGSHIYAPDVIATAAVAIGVRFSEPFDARPCPPRAA